MASLKQLVFLIYSPLTEKPGGRENWIMNIAPWMKSRGYTISVLCYRSRQKDLYSPSDYDTELVRVTTLRTLIPSFLFWAKVSLGLLVVLDLLLFIAQSCRLAKKFIGGATDEVYFIAMGTVIEGLAAWYIWTQLEYSRMIVAVRGKAPLELAQALPYLKPFVYSIEKMVLRRVKNVWANGYDTANDLATLGVDCTVIPNGVNYMLFSNPSAAVPSGRLRLGEQPRPLIVMSIATLRQIKGIPYLTEATPEISQFTQQQFRVLFVGAGSPVSYQTYLNAKRCGHAEFLGPIPSHEVIHAADVVVCVSGGSGMSMSALEAMAAGKAIVAWDSPVYQQLLVQGHSALLVPEHDSIALARAIAILLENPSMRDFLGANAQIAAKQYDWQVVADVLDQALDIV